MAAYSALPDRRICGQYFTSPRLTHQVAIACPFGQRPRRRLTGEMEYGELPPGAAYVEVSVCGGGSGSFSVHCAEDGTPPGPPWWARPPEYALRAISDACMTIRGLRPPQEAP